MVNLTSVVSFRAHRNLKGWLTTAGKGFSGGTPELLRLIIQRAAFEQASMSGLGALLGRLGKDNRQPSIGNTSVYAVRLPQSTINLIRDAAKTKDQGVSQWASAALFSWYQSFKEYQEAHKNDDGDWLEVYVMAYQNKVNELADVYALKAGRQVG